MMNFVDISSHQGDINVAALPIDSIIVKATQGTNYVNPWCDTKVQEAIRRGLPWGFYHFADSNSPVDEADFFIENTLGYLGEGIPVLDWEGVHDDDGNLIYEQSVEWVNQFVSRFHERTGVWPWIYANPWRFNQGGVNPNCARWVAAYASHLLYPDFNVDEGEPPATDGNVVALQFASDGRISGYDGNLDMNRFYGTADQWRAYAIGDKKAPEPEPAPTPEPEPQPEPEKPSQGSLTAEEIAEAVADKLAARLKE